jgi:hypothetical protein
MHNSKTPTYSIELERISEALISSGCTSLDEQAKALGLCRSTVWTITKSKHKLGRLSAKTINRILENPKTPKSVRTLVEQYKSQRLVVAHGKAKQRLKRLSKVVSGNKKRTAGV